MDGLTNSIKLVWTDLVSEKISTSSAYHYEITNIQPSGYRLISVLSQPRNNPVLDRKALWEADSVEECMEIAQHIENHRALQIVFNTHTKNLTDQLEFSNSICNISFNKSNVTAVIDFDANTNRSYVNFEWVDWKIAWAMQKPAIGLSGYNSLITVKENWQAANLIIDNIEKISGLPVIPWTNNDNNSNGRLFDEFWMDRFNSGKIRWAELQARRNHQKKMEETFFNEMHYADDPYVLIAISHVTGWPLQIACKEDNLHGRFITSACCITPEGKAFTGKGFSDRIQVNSDMKSDEKVVISQVESGELKDILAKDCIHLALKGDDTNQIAYKFAKNRFDIAKAFITRHLNLTCSVDIYDQLWDESLDCLQNKTGPLS